ncbi:uncharacterized protein FIBRA_01240 [Fibroporia radiculosa]|uniref:Heme peroxidase n=1 Tax=Fibroporia radiculosa TaxID=599839 RepID=J4GJN3_9APHY|nr:uncharacterized protein FIBRA_01240 [Fibroporia radiculosa]CCL99225.1 predicted protein [Fibroporia radiculosa]
MRSLVCFVFASIHVASASHWPYGRTRTAHFSQGAATDGKPEFDAMPDDLYLHWLRSTIASHSELQTPFVNNTIPDDVKSLEDLWNHVDFPKSPTDDRLAKLRTPHLPTVPPHREATSLFSNLGYPIDPTCSADKAKWFYRTTDGSCNWLQTDHAYYGQLGQPHSRDYNQYFYKDGISEPRDGPNARAVSNAFFKRKQRLYYDHTPVLLGLIEFIMHDVTYSEDSLTEFVDVPMPDDEETFPLNTTFRVWRTEAVAGTGTSLSNPRQTLNQATNWIDVSSLYGSTTEVSRALRSFDKGKLRTSPGNYLPFNSMGLPMRTRPGVDVKSLFAGGDPRTNEDWIMLSVHTLLLRDHNRMCDLLATQHPEYNDERIYQTVRLAMAAKFQLIANSYQMAYWQTSGNDSMPWPRDDGFPLYRQMYGKDVLELNPIHSYPWPLVTKDGKPMAASAEMAIVYRFHEFIIPSFPLKDTDNKTIYEKDLFESAFDAKGFVEAGLENILRGIVATDIPNFKSGIDEAFRSAGRYRGSPFDIATWSIVHEREQGLPTFNQYFRAYNSHDPAVVIPIRKRFEDFSSDPEAVANLKRLYKHPDDVDLVVGCQLEETMFPGTTVPSSALIISLFSLFGLGNSDRFSVGYAMMRCMIVDAPWDCTPTNALEELIWKPRPIEGFPRARWLNMFWLSELDLQAHGTNLLWRLIAENSEIDCLQKNPLFPYNPETNPVLCSLTPKTNWIETALTGLEVVIVLVKEHRKELLTALSAIPIFFLIWALRREIRPGQPPLMWKWPLFGVALQFKSDPTGLVKQGMKKWSGAVFGLELANTRQFVITKPEDVQAIIDDGPYEIKFSLHDFLASVNTALITGDANFATDLHTKIIRAHLHDEATLAGFAKTVEDAAHSFFAAHPLVARDRMSEHYTDLNDYLYLYIAYVVSRCVVGPEGFDNPELLKIFLQFNDDSVNAMGLATLLPSFLRFIARRPITTDWKKMRPILVPLIAKRRQVGGGKDYNLLNFVIPEVQDDEQASDMLGLLVWIGLTNLQASLTSTFFDIVNQSGLQGHVVRSLSDATLRNLSMDRTEPWKVLRGAVFESIRLSGPATGPARTALQPFQLPSEPGRYIPRGQAGSLSAYYRHRETSAWGEDAPFYKADRFIEQDPPIGSDRFVSFGPNTPHLCPGRWFALQSIQVMTKAILEEYDFAQDRVLSDDEKYRYSSGSVYRNPVGITVRHQRKPFDDSRG